jgi:hypothetical protein
MRCDGMRRGAAACVEVSACVVCLCGGVLVLHVGHKVRTASVVFVSLFGPACKANTMAKVYDFNVQETMGGGES